MRQCVSSLAAAGMGEHLLPVLQRFFQISALLKGIQSRLSPAASNRHDYGAENFLLDSRRVVHGVEMLEQAPKSASACDHGIKVACIHLSNSSKSSLFGSSRVFLANDKASSRFSTANTDRELNDDMLALRPSRANSIIAICRDIRSSARFSALFRFSSACFNPLSTSNITVWLHCPGPMLFCALTRTK